MKDKTFWENWSKKHKGLSAVIIASKPIVMYRNFLENIVFNYVKLNKNDNILEIGCGNGRWIRRLENKGFENLTGIDFSKNLIKEAKRYSKAKFYVMNSARLKFKNKSFDTTLILLVLPHTDWNIFKKTLQEAARVTKNKIIIMDEPYTLGSVWNINDIKNILKDFKLVKIKAVRTELLTRILRREPNVSKIKKEDVSVKDNYFKSFVKILFEFPIDLFCMIFNYHKIAFEKLMIFEKK